jgi:hypothetical protein
MPFPGLTIGGVAAGSIALQYRRTDQLRHDRLVPSTDRHVGSDVATSSICGVANATRSERDRGAPTAGSGCVVHATYRSRVRLGVGVSPNAGSGRGRGPACGAPFALTEGVDADASTPVPGSRARGHSFTTSASAYRN